MSEAYEVTDKAQWPEALAEIWEVLKSGFVRRKDLPPEDAARLAETVVLDLAHHMGGRHFYLPRGTRLKLWVRDRQILEAYTGGASMSSLAKRHRVCGETVRLAIRRQQRLSALLAGDDASTPSTPLDHPPGKASDEKTRE